MRGTWKRWLSPAPALALVALSGAAEAAGVTVLGHPELGVFATIQGAVDAAQHGDVLLVDAGSYTGFVIDDKALTVLADGAVNVHGTTRVKNLGPQRTVTLIGLNITAADNVWNSYHGLELRDDAGHVRVQSCVLTGSRYTNSFNWLVGSGVSVANCARVMFTQSTLTGRDHGFNSGYAPVAGGDGLVAVDSAVAIYDCTLRGGKGSEESYPAGGKGGAGCRATNFGVFVSGSTLRAGNGGGGDYIGCTAAGDGGDALVLDGAQAQLLDEVLTPGLGNGFYTCTPGNNGQAIASNGGVVSQLAGARRKASAVAQTTDNSILYLTITGQPGDRVWLMRSKKLAFLYQVALHGVLALPKPPSSTLEYLGVIEPTGTLLAPYAIGDVVGPEAGWIWNLQVLCVDPTRQQYLSGALHVLVHNT